MSTMSSDEERARLQGQAEIRSYLLGIIDTTALKCAVELRIADIIHSHSAPITLSQLASAIAAQSEHNNSSSVDTVFLGRVMRWLVHKRIFSVSHPSDGAEAVYGLTHSSRWLLHGSEQSMAPLIALVNQHWWSYPCQYMSQCVKESGVSVFKKAFGVEIYEFMSGNAEASAVYNNGMAAESNIVSEAIVSGYKQGFNNITSLVDVGGGKGAMGARIAQSYPHIKVTNYDLPHVIATAPAYDGLVSHIGGDIFVSIPSADALFMKWILHGFKDEDCVKILKNCKKAIPEKTGKLIIVEFVIQPEGEGNGGLDVGIGYSLDLAMAVHTIGGKERTEAEWKKLLEEGGFPSYKLIKISAMESIIEAYPC